MREIMGYGCLFSAIATAAAAREITKHHAFAQDACVAVVIAVPAGCCVILFGLWAVMKILGVQ